MRVSDERSGSLFSYVDLEARVRRDHPLRAIREVTNEALAAACRGFGYQRLQVLLQRERLHVNHRRSRPIYRDEKLQVRRRGGRKRVSGIRRRTVLPESLNQHWLPADDGTEEAEAPVSP